MRNKPEKKFKIGGVTATVWKNEDVKAGVPFSYYTVTVEKNYKDKTEEWNTTSSFNTKDLPNVEIVSREAYKYLRLVEVE